MFPSKVAGDFVAKNMLLQKYDLPGDKVTDELLKKYKVQNIPTFIFLDGDGNETVRLVGSMMTTNDFIKELSEAMKPENSLAMREKKFREKPETAIEYFTFLKNNNYPMVDSLFMNYFAAAPVEKKFSPEWIAFYQREVQTVGHHVVDYMLDNQKVISKIIGKEKYGTFVKDVYIRIVTVAVAIGRQEDLDNVLAKAKSYPIVRSGFSEFVEKNRQILLDKNYPAIIVAINSGIENCGSKTRESLLELVAYASGNSQGNLKDQVGLYEKAARCEKDIQKSQEYTVRVRLMKKYLEQEQTNRND